MSNANEVMYSFQAEWLEDASGLVRRYVLTFFESDNSVQMSHHPDSDAHGLFLKRKPIPSIQKQHLYLGAKITFLGRTIKLIDFADESTRRALGGAMEKTFMVIKPCAYQNMGKIFAEVRDLGFTFSNVKMVKLTRENATALFECSAHDADYLSSDVVVAVEMVGDNAVEKFQNACQSLNAKYSQDGKSALHASSDPARDIKVLASFDQASTALFSNCTLGIIRPSAMGNMGEIIDDILKNNFEISAMQQFSLEMVEAKKFLEVYSGVLPEFPELTKELCSGPCLAMEIRQENAVNAFRELVGPFDPEVAKLLRSNTLRAKYGLDRGRNAMHCTDLAEDGQLEVEYFFKILQDL